MDIRNNKIIVNKKAFTLIEVLVWISISTMLMISIWLLITGWIKNITEQWKVLNSWSNVSIFEDEINSILNLVNINYTPKFTNSWIILKINNNFDKWWFVYLWYTWSTINSENGNWVYCDSGSLDLDTKHIFTKTFIPFEEDNWEDIFLNFSDILESNEVTIWWNDYKTFQKEHRVAVKNWANRLTVVWKWIPWDYLNSSLKWKNTYLNSPTWLIKHWNILFISDTLNNRVLYYDTVSDEVLPLLDENDWLIEPTGLIYNDTLKELHIVNSWRGEIITYSSKSTPNKDIEILNLDDSNSKLYISFYNQDWKFNISWITTSDFTFSPVDLKWTWDSINTIWNNLVYSFSWSIDKFIENVTITNISGLFNTPGTYYMKAWFNKEVYKYLVQSDDDILTKTDNTIEVLYSWEEYPTWIWWTWTSSYKKSWEWNNIENLDFNNSIDSILETPIKNIEYDYTDSLLTIKITYYSKFNCYNSDERSEKTIILKKNFK